jgi:DNA-binding MarR family transcriptional regulator
VPDDRLVDALDRLARAGVSITTRAIVEEAAAFDLTLAQWRALVVVCEAGINGIRVGDVGRRQRLAAPAASRLVRRLEGRGLVVVARDAPDRRAAIVRATDAGRGIWTAVILRRRGLIEAALDRTELPVVDDLVDRLEVIATALVEGA